MRIALLLLISGLAAFGVHAQQISGVAKDTEGKPLNGASVTLLKDTIIIKLAATKENGWYTFNGIKEGTYRIRATFVGYTPAVSAPFAVAGTDVKVPDLQMAKGAGDLKGILSQPKSR